VLFDLPVEHEGFTRSRNPKLADCGRHRRRVSRRPIVLRADGHEAASESDERRDDRRAKS
jgi:hypothetical protein